MYTTPSHPLFLHFKNIFKSPFFWMTSIGIRILPFWYFGTTKKKLKVEIAQLCQHNRGNYTPSTIYQKKNDKKWCLCRGC